MQPYIWYQELRQAKRYVSLIIRFGEVIFPLMEALNDLRNNRKIIEYVSKHASPLPNNII